MNKTLKPRVYTFHYPEQNPENLHPDEDFTLIDENIFAVFDGITLAFQNPYPNPSPAAKAAEMAAKSVAEKLNVKEDSLEPINLLLQAFDFANQKIKEYNTTLGITTETLDYTTKQYAAVVGAFGFLKDNILYFGQINDCGVIVFDQMGNREIDFILDQTPIINHLNRLAVKGKFKRKSKEDHIYVRSKVVNNPNLEENGKKVHFGVMTGEDIAKKFFHFGSSQVSEGQIALFYSDGFVPFLSDPEFTKLLLLKLSEVEIKRFVESKIAKGDPKYKKEKSLIVLNF